MNHQKKQFVIPALIGTAGCGQPTLIQGETIAVFWAHERSDGVCSHVVA